MGDTVFANNQAVACKASNGKSIAAFPDVCLTPPTPPAGPIPVPYPNTAMASDLADGSTSVKIEKKPVLLGSKSNFSTSTGDEAGTQGGNVVTHKTKGKAYFAVYSFDVKVEGEGVARNLDMTTHNHASPVPGTPPWVHASALLFKKNGVCDGVDAKFKLTPYKDGCPDGKTPHHVIPHRQMKGRGGKTYSHGDAPCICVTGRNQYTKQHGKCHAICDPPEYEAHKNRDTYTYDESSTWGAKACGGATDGKPLAANSKAFKCLKAQLDAYYKDSCNLDDSSPMKKSGKRGKNVPSNKKKGKISK